MKSRNSNKIFLVYTNATVISERSANHLKPQTVQKIGPQDIYVLLHSIGIKYSTGKNYSLPEKEQMYFGFRTRAGALRHIQLKKENRRKKAMVNRSAIRTVISRWQADMATEQFSFCKTNRLR